MGYKPNDYKLCNSEELAEAAYQARSDMTQKEVADHLEVTKQSVSKAESKKIGSKMNRLRIRIITEIGGYDVDGPYWIVRPSDEDHQ
jgi:DNA-binding XRE family transcriptional regulator